MGQFSFIQIQESSFKVVFRMFYTIGHYYQPSMSWWLDPFSIEYCYTSS